MTEEADKMDFVGYDPVKQLVAEGINRLWAAACCTLQVSVLIDSSRYRY